MFDQPAFWAWCRGKYGPTFSIVLPGYPPMVVTSDREAARRIFSGDPLTRHHGGEALRPLVGDGSLLLLEPAEHLERRRVESPPFHGEHLRGYTDLIRELSVQEIATWKHGEVVASHLRARTVTMTIVLQVVVGLHDERLKTQVADILDSFNNPWYNLGVLLPRALGRRAWWNPLTRPFYARRDALRGMLLEQIELAEADPDLRERRDVVSTLVRARDAGGPELAADHLCDELLTLVLAGYDPPAIAMAWGCELLAHHPDVATRLRETLADGDRGYLSAVVKEVLRVRTIAYASAARQPLEPIEVGDWLIGPDAVILIDAQGVHGDPHLHPDPEKFRPERFLAEQPDSYAYVPFGGGAHRCLGAALATLELELFLEALVKQVGLAPAGPPARPLRRGSLLMPANAGRVHILRLQPGTPDAPELSLTAGAGVRT